MTGPRDQVQPLAVAVNSENGKPLTEMQLFRLSAIREASVPLYEAMHLSDGSTSPGEHQDHTWATRRMSVAATYLEIALMMARKAALE
jgi:hypothetical protein